MVSYGILGPCRLPTWLHPKNKPPAMVQRSVCFVLFAFDSLTHSKKRRQQTRTVRYDTTKDTTRTQPLLVGLTLDMELQSWRYLTITSLGEDWSRRVAVLAPMDGMELVNRKIYTKVSVVFFADFYSQYFYCFLGSRTAKKVTYAHTSSRFDPPSSD